MFIVIDGIDGSGKSTQIDLLYDFLQKNTNQRVIKTREPGGSEIGENIRQILLLPSNHDKFTELFLYLAARREHFLDCIKPEIDNNSIVLCDRFFYSTIAYQGYGFGIDPNLLEQLNTIILPKKYLPNVTLILNLQVEIAISRAKQAGNTKYEDTRDKEFFINVQEAFIKLSADQSTHLIDGARDIQTIHNEIVQKISKHPNLADSLPPLKKA